MNYKTTCSHFFIKFKYISSATPKRTTIEVPTLYKVWHSIVVKWSYILPPLMCNVLIWPLTYRLLLTLFSLVFFNLLTQDLLLNRLTCLHFGILCDTVWSVSRPLVLEVAESNPQELKVRLTLNPNSNLSGVLAGLYVSGRTKLEVLISFTWEKKKMIMSLSWVDF